MYMIVPLLPLFPFPLTWNPPCCDRIRPPLPWVARKLTPVFPSPADLAPYPKSRPPGVSQTQNRHSLGRHCEPDPYARLQYSIWKIQGGFFFSSLREISQLILTHQQHNGAGRHVLCQKSKRWRKIPVGFSSINSVEEQNVDNYKKLEKQWQHELFRCKVRNLLTATCTVLYEKFPWAFLL